MRLTELFNSAVRVEWHNITPRVTIAPFECDGLQYEIRVEVLKLRGEIGYNVGFARVNGEERIQTITNDTKSVVRALSMIANAVAERVRDEGPSFVFAGAADNVDQRLRVYRNLVQMVVRKNPDYVVVDGITLFDENGRQIQGCAAVHKDVPNPEKLFQ